MVDLGRMVFLKGLTHFFMVECLCFIAFHESMDLSYLADMFFLCIMKLFNGMVHKCFVFEFIYGITSSFRGISYD